MPTDSITPYIVNLTPDGRMVTKEKMWPTKFYEKGGGKIIARDKFPRSSISGQYERIFTAKNKYFVIAMDNYFTLSKANNGNVTGFRDRSCRHCKVFVPGGPPGQNIEEIDDGQINFNEISLLERWFTQDITSKVDLKLSRVSR